MLIGNEYFWCVKSFLSHEGADHLSSEGGGGGFNTWIHNEIFFFEYALACYFCPPPAFCRNFFLCGWG